MGASILQFCLSIFINYNSALNHKTCDTLWYGDTSTLNNQLLVALIIFNSSFNVNFLFEFWSKMTLVKDDKQNEVVDILNKDNTNDTEDNLEDCSLPCFKLKIFNNFRSPTWFLGSWCITKRSIIALNIMHQIVSEMKFKNLLGLDNIIIYGPCLIDYFCLWGTGLPSSVLNA